MNNLLEFNKLYVQLINQYDKNIHILKSDNIFLNLKEGNNFNKKINNIFKYIRKNKIRGLEFNVIVIYLEIIKCKIKFFKNLLKSKINKFNNVYLTNIIQESILKLNEYINIINHLTN